MARYTGPVCRLCRTEQRKLFLKGARCKSDKCALNKKRGFPGKDPKARIGKKSEYSGQLREKQKIKRMYNMLEKQFHLFFERALRMSGVTGENLIALLESRLDNVVYRMRFASSRSQARQIVTHGHILVNGKRVNIPSYEVKPGDVVEVKEGSRKLVSILDSLSEVSKSGVVSWIELDIDAQKGVYLAAPKKGEVADLADIKEQLVVELYSK
jgi:small subunit ribosomal protein S4